MSKITAVIDTAKETIDIDIDGKKLKDCMSITAFISEYDDGKLYLSMMTCQEDEGSDRHIHNNISLAKEGKLQRVEKVVGKDEHRNWLGTPNEVTAKQNEELRKQLGKLIASTKSRVNLD